VTVLDECEAGGAGEMVLADTRHAQDILPMNIHLKLSSIIRIILALENALSLTGGSFAPVAFTL
jgi:hypothetical protein